MKNSLSRCVCVRMTGLKKKNKKEIVDMNYYYNWTVSLFFCFLLFSSYCWSNKQKIQHFVFLFLTKTKLRLEILIDYSRILRIKLSHITTKFGFQKNVDTV